MNELERILTGLTQSHTTPISGPDSPLIHKEIKKPYLELIKAASAEGIELHIGSGFRSFEKQLTIWNEKCLGKRPVMDSNGKPLDVKKLSEKDLIFAILNWSALPGFSRHHWGTDLDIFDKAATPPNYHVQFTPEEIITGPFQKLGEWLTEYLEDYDFFRPYSKDLGGVKPEWWHISYAPIAVKYSGALKIELLEKTLAGSAIEKKTVVLKHLPTIFEQLGRISAQSRNN